MLPHSIKSHHFFRATQYHNAMYVKPNETEVVHEIQINYTDIITQDLSEDQDITEAYKETARLDQ